MRILLHGSLVTFPNSNVISVKTLKLYQHPNNLVSTKTTTHEQKEITRLVKTADNIPQGFCFALCLLLQKTSTLGVGVVVVSSSSSS